MFKWSKFRCFSQFYVVKIGKLFNIKVSASDERTSLLCRVQVFIVTVKNFIEEALGFQN
jgi:hypothetical protein